MDYGVLLEIIYNKQLLFILTLNIAFIDEKSAGLI
jgi:hypothetical protein